MGTVCAHRPFLLPNSQFTFQATLRIFARSFVPDYPTDTNWVPLRPPLSVDLKHVLVFSPTDCARLATRSFGVLPLTVLHCRIAGGQLQQCGDHACFLADETASLKRAPPEPAPRNPCTT